MPHSSSRAARRIYRLALGASLCLVFSQAFGWTLSFVAPVLTLMILSTPLPPLGLKKSIGLLIALVGPVVLFGVLLLPSFQYVRPIGILMVSLCLFYSFYFTARGGNPVLGNMMTIGLALVITIGSISSAALLEIAKGLAISVIATSLFVALAHVLLPDLAMDQPTAAPAKPAGAPPDEAGAVRKALRAMAVVMPLTLVLLAAGSSPTYTVVMIKVATMGQQATADHSSAMGDTLMTSTLYGGLAALAGWFVLGIWPSLLIFGLVVALAGLIFGQWIFSGDGLHPRFQTMNYAFATMIIILAPAVMDQVTGSDAGTAFWNRLLLFALIGVYGTLAVRVYDAYFPRSTDPSKTTP